MKRRYLLLIAAALAACIPLDLKGPDDDPVSSTGSSSTTGDTCVPTTCADLQFTCGLAEDSCGGTLDCGACAAPEACGPDNTCGCFWATEPIASASVADTAIAQGPDGTVFIVYLDNEEHVVRAAVRSADTWSIEPVADIGEYGYGVHAATDSEGGLHVVFEYSNGVDLKYAYRGLDGVWSVETLDPEGEDGDIAVDAAGTVHISYVTFDDVHYAYRPAGASSFITEIARPVGTWGGTSIAVDGSGAVHITYHPFFADGLDRSWKAPGGAWQDEKIDAEDDAGWSSSMIADAEGGLHVVYQRGTSFDAVVKYAYKAPGGTWSPTQVAWDDGSFDFALDSAGEVRIIHKTAFSLLELIRGVPGRPWSTESTKLDSTGASILIDSKGRTQLALGVDGQLALASFPCE